MIPICIYCPVFLFGPLRSTQKIYFPKDYYLLNGKLSYARAISGSQEHILKLFLINVYSADLVAVYEFVTRLCKQSKAVIDNVLSFDVIIDAFGVFGSITVKLNAFDAIGAISGVISCVVC